MKRGPNEYGVRLIRRSGLYDDIRKRFEFHNIYKWVSPTNPLTHRPNERGRRHLNDERNIFVHVALRDEVITEEKMKDIGEGIADLIQKFSSLRAFDKFFSYGGVIESWQPLPL